MSLDDVCSYLSHTTVAVFALNPLPISTRFHPNDFHQTALAVVASIIYERDILREKRKRELT